MTSEIVTLCCWPRTRCPQVAILRDEQKIIIKGENPETGELKGEVELDFKQAKLLRDVLAKI